MKHFYAAYGLSISSDLALPELLAGTENSGAPDVLFDLSAAPGENPAQSFCRLGREITQMGWPGVGIFHLEAGRRVRIWPAPGVPETTLRAFLLGPVLSTLLYQRGFLVLHASSVALRDARGDWGAIGFLGNSGEGKSTMAAAMHARGHRMMSDDVLAVPIPGAAHRPFDSHGSAKASADAGRKAIENLPPKSSENWDQSSDASANRDANRGAEGELEAGVRTLPLVFPAFPVLRLFPQSVAALGEDAAALPRLYPQEERRARQAERDFEGSGAPLRALFVLELGEAPAVRRLAPGAALLQLIRYTYCVFLRDPVEAAAQFGKCGILAQTVPVFAIQRPRDLARLSEVAALVETNWMQT